MHTARFSIWRSLAFIMLLSPESLTAANSPTMAGLWAEAVPCLDDAATFYVATDGKPENGGTWEAPWDITSVLAGTQAIPPGSVVWIRQGRYLYPVRSSEERGFEVRLSGEQGQPIHVRAYPGERATIDGGVCISARHLWIWDIEFHIGESWRPTAPAPQGASTVFPVPSGIITVLDGKEIKLINCISHGNTMGVGFWKRVEDGEMHGCVVYDNGFVGSDRPHGPAIYTQNSTGTTRRITNNIIAGNFSLALQAYSATDMTGYVADHHVEGNIVYAPRLEARGRNYLLCGGADSKNMVLLNNLVYGYDVRMGDQADQIAQGNLILRGHYSGPMAERNRMLAPRHPDAMPVHLLHPNKYDPRRAHLAVANWVIGQRVTAYLSPFLAKGDRYRVLNPFDLFGKPLLRGTYRGGAVQLPLPPVPWRLETGNSRELVVYIVVKDPPPSKLPGTPEADAVSPSRQGTRHPARAIYRKRTEGSGAFDVGDASVSYGYGRGIYLPAP